MIQLFVISTWMSFSQFKRMTPKSHEIPLMHFFTQYLDLKSKQNGAK